MRLTSALFKKVKSKHILVQMESAVSGHRFNIFRERLGDKAELFRFDPFIQQIALYREKKKVRSAAIKEFRPYKGVDPFTL